MQSKLSFQIFCICSLLPAMVYTPCLPRFEAESSCQLFMQREHVALVLLLQGRSVGVPLLIGRIRHLSLWWKFFFRISLCILIGGGELSVLVSFHFDSSFEGRIFFKFSPWISMGAGILFLVVSCHFYSSFEGRFFSNFTVDFDGCRNTFFGNFMSLWFKFWRKDYFQDFTVDLDWCRKTSFVISFHFDSSFEKKFFFQDFTVYLDGCRNTFFCNFISLWFKFWKEYFPECRRIFRWVQDTFCVNFMFNGALFCIWFPIKIRGY